MQVQKWIVGRKIPKPQETLQALNVTQSGTTVFLYLLSGKTVGLKRSDVEKFGRGNATPTSSTLSAANSSGSGSFGVTTTTAATTASVATMRHAVSVPNLSQNESHVLAAPNRVEQLSASNPLPQVRPNPQPSVANQRENSGPATLPIHLGMSINDMRDILAQSAGGQGDGSANPPNPPPQEMFVNNLLEPVEQQAEEDGHPVGWTCEVCTYINQPTRPGCEMCSTDRPAGYVVPAGVQLDERERDRIAAEEREEALFQQVCARVFCSLTLSLLKWPKQKIHQKFQISFRKILRNK